MDESLDIYELTMVNCDERNNLNRPIHPMRENQSLKKLPTKKKKSPEPHRFRKEFYHIFKEKLIAITSNYSVK